MYVTVTGLVVEVAGDAPPPPKFQVCVYPPGKAGDAVNVKEFPVRHWLGDCVNADVG